MCCISEEERKLLLEVIDKSNLVNEKQKKYASIIKNKLIKFKGSSSKLVSCDKVVTLGKVVNIKTYFGARSGLKIVLPEQADLINQKLSILSDIGVAIYGESEGTTVSWMMGDELELVEITLVKSNEL